MNLQKLLVQLSLGLLFGLDIYMLTLL